MVPASFTNRLTQWISFESKQRIIALVVILVVVACTGVSITNYLTDRIKENIIKENEETLHSASVYLASKMNEMDTADDILAGLPWAAAVLESKTSQDIVRANNNLSNFNTEKGTSVCYLLDRDGTVVASSNFDAPDSFIGKNYSDSKYFNQALRGMYTIDFAVSAYSANNGLYGSSAVRDRNNRVIGVAVVKQDMDFMEAPFKKYPHSFFINHCGMILWSSNPSAPKSLWPPEKKTTGNGVTIIHSDMNQPSAPLFAYELKNGMEIGFDGSVYRVSRKLIGKDGWSVVFLTNTAEADAYRTGGFLITAAVLLILILIATFFHFHSAAAPKMIDIYHRIITLKRYSS